MRSLRSFFEKTEPYILTFEQREKYLYAFVGEGEDSLEISLEFWHKILQECNRTKYNSVLFEQDLECILPSGEVYEHAIEITKMGFENSLIGFVGRRAELAM